MSHKLYNIFNKKKTPQNQPIPGRGQVPNNAGGYAWALDPWARLMRFLILGTEGGTYYVSEQTLTRENAENVLHCLEEDPKRFVDTIVDVSESGKAYKNDPALFALALALADENQETRVYAGAALPKVARIGTHLFHFADYINGLRGWGRGLRRVISDWYLSKDTEALAFQMAKYQSRDGWSHADLLRLAHPTPPDETTNKLFQWATGQDIPAEELPGMVQGLERLKQAENEDEVIELIKAYRAPREVIPTEYLKSPEVWEAMLPGLGLTATLRNLGNLSKIGLLTQGAWDVVDQVTSRIVDAGALKQARVHPLQVLAALITYKSGHGALGKGEWTPVPQVVDALNEAFGLSFETVHPTGKRLYLGLDVSGSMTRGHVGGIPGLSPRMASAALAMVTMQTEKHWIIKGFTGKLVDLGLNARMDLARVVKSISDLPFGSTDCAQPMLDAIKHRLEVDAFVIYTDNETWFGKIHPAQALNDYRQKTGIPAKLVVVGMVANNVTIADPDDPFMLDVVGFSTSTPNAIGDFIGDRMDADS
jgi:60 kDa SS-A/Ro ribonucleoprotein